MTPRATGRLLLVTVSVAGVELEHWVFAGSATPDEAIRLAEASERYDPSDHPRAIQVAGARNEILWRSGDPADRIGAASLTPDEVAAEDRG